MRDLILGKAYFCIYVKCKHLIIHNLILQCFYPNWFALFYQIARFDEIVGYPRRPSVMPPPHLYVIYGEWISIVGWHTQVP